MLSCRDATLKKTRAAALELAPTVPADPEPPTSQGVKEKRKPGPGPTAGLQQSIPAGLEGQAILSVMPTSCMSFSLKISTLFSKMIQAKVLEYYTVPENLHAYSIFGNISL